MRGDIRPQSAPVDDQLTRLIAAWPGLPDDARRRILAIVASAAGQGGAA